jgi:hypothetical protein
MELTHCTILSGLQDKFVTTHSQLLLASQEGDGHPQGSNIQYLLQIMPAWSWPETGRPQENGRHYEGETKTSKRTWAYGKVWAWTP